MRIPRDMYQKMVVHAKKEAPLESCGIMGGHGQEALRFYPTPNLEQSPSRYSIPPQEMLRVLHELDQLGLDLIGLFHSHPLTEALPSAADVRLAYYPDAVYLILSLKHPDRPDLKGFHIRNGAISSVPHEIV